MREHNKTILLFACVVAVGAAAWAISRTPTSDERVGLLHPLSAADISSLTLEREDLAVSVRRQSADSWIMSQPLQEPADSDAIARLLENLELTEFRPATAADLPRSKPDIRIRAGNAVQGTNLVIELYAPRSAEQRAFARCNGRVMLVPASLYERLAALSAFDLRAKAVAPAFAQDEISRVTLARGTETLDCVRRDHAWVRADGSLRVDSRRLLAALETVWHYRLKPADILSGAEGVPSDREYVTITIFAGTREQTWTVTADGKLKVAGIPVVYRLPDHLQSALDPLLSEPLVPRQVADFDQHEVASIHFSGSKVDLGIERSERSWHFDAGQQSADTEVTTGFLRALLDTPIASETTAPKGLAFTRVTMRDAGGSVLEVLEIARQDATLLLRRPPATAVHKLEPGHALEMFELTRLGFTDRTVIQERAEFANELNLTTASGSSKVVWDEDERRWHLSEPVEGETDEEHVRDLLRLFTGLRAESYKTPTVQDPSRYGLDTPQVVLSARFAPPGEQPYTRSLGLGAKEGNSIYAHLDDSGPVFVLPAGVLGVIPPTLASRVVCRARDLRRFTVSADGRTSGAQYDAAGHVWTDLSGRPLGPDTPHGRAAALLSDFVARDIASYTLDSYRQYGFRDPTLVVRLDQATVRGKRIIVGHKAPNGGYYVRGTASRFVLIVAEEQVRALLRVLPSDHQPSAD